MKKITFLALCAGSWLLPLSPAALAQGPRPFEDGPPDGPPRFGGGPRGRGGRGMGEKGGLMRLWRGIGHLDEEKPLSKTQSKRIVALILPWSKKPTMTQTEAKSLRQKLEVTLTSAQKSLFDGGPRGFGGPPREGPPFRGGPEEDGPRGRGPGDGGPEGRPGGGPRDGGRRGGPGGGGMRGGGMRGEGPGGRGPELSEAQRQTLSKWREVSNPFYAPTGNPGWKTLPAAFQKDEARRYRENRATLEAFSRRSR